MKSLDLALFCAATVALAMVAVRLYCAMTDPDSAFHEWRAQRQEEAWDRAELQP